MYLLSNIVFVNMFLSKYVVLLFSIFIIYIYLYLYFNICIQYCTINWKYLLFLEGFFLVMVILLCLSVYMSVGIPIPYHVFSYFIILILSIFLPLQCVCLSVYDYNHSGRIYVIITLKLFHSLPKLIMPVCPSRTC